MTNISALPDGLENFDDMSLNGAMNRGARERLSAPEIMATLPNLEDVLKYPPTSGSPADQAMVKNIIYRLSIRQSKNHRTCCGTVNYNCVNLNGPAHCKDYALEPDLEKYRTAARQMVKSLAGSLALVTCKERSE